MVLIEDNTPPEIAAQLYASAGRSWMNQDRRRALQLLERAADLFLRLRDQMSLASISNSLGNMHYSLGHYDKATRSYEMAREILTDAGKTGEVLFTHYGLGLVAAATNDLAGARRHFASTFDLTCVQKDEFLKNYVSLAIAEMDFMEDKLDVGIERMHCILNRLRSLQPRLLLHAALLSMGAFLIALGRLPEARDCTAEALAEVRDGENYIRQLCLQQLALLGALAGRLPEAARLIGFVEAGVPSANKDDRTTANYVHHRLSRLLADGLDEAARLTYAAEGAKWREEQAIAYAQTELIARWERFI